MSVRDLIPWGRGNGNSAPSLFPDGDRDPFVSLHREVNRLFDDAFRSFGARLPAFSPSFAATWPSVEISDTDKEVRVTAEIPGLDESDIEVLLDNGALKLKGEKRS
ncbi:Hsp20/alpha crystallin family protein, partial [Mesorhizobium sp. M7A.F.Ca.US.006.04.2.1]